MPEYMCMHVARQILQAIDSLYDRGCDCHRDLLVFKNWLAEDAINLESWMQMFTASACWPNSDDEEDGWQW